MLFFFLSFVFSFLHQGVDVEAVGKINGVPTYEFDLDSVDDKPWRKPGGWRNSPPYIDVHLVVWPCIRGTRSACMLVTCFTLLLSDDAMLRLVHFRKFLPVVVAVSSVHCSSLTTSSQASSNLHGGCGYSVFPDVFFFFFFLLYLLRASCLCRC